MQKRFHTRDSRPSQMPLKDKEQAYPRKTRSVGGHKFPRNCFSLNCQQGQRDPAQKISPCIRRKMQYKSNSEKCCPKGRRRTRRTYTQPESPFTVLGKVARI